MNDLQNEKSPYLLQHIDNPVHWYPWNEQAFALAREKNRLIFLSIGYSTCHWCHVMAHECFEDEEVAALLNADFVAIKVDREERPDIDQVYMDICQRLTGNSDWRSAAEKLMQSVAAEVSRYPAGYTRLLQSSDWLLRPAREIVIVDGDRSSAMIDIACEANNTQTVILHKTMLNSNDLARVAPYTADMSLVDGKTTAYVCQGFSCMQPVTNQQQFKDLLDDSF